MYGSSYWTMTVQERHEGVATSADNWYLQALDGLLKELILCGWTKSNCAQAFRRSRASALVREPTKTVLHRIAALKHLEKHASEAWDRFADEFSQEVSQAGFPVAPP